jgi:putative permease
LDQKNNRQTDEWQSDRKILLDSQLQILNRSPVKEPDPSELRPVSYPDLRHWLLFVVLTVAVCTVTVFLKSALLIFAVSIVTAMILNGPVAALEQRGVHRSISVVVVCLFLVGLFALAMRLLVPPFLEQSDQLIRQLPADWTRIYNQTKEWLQKYPYVQAVIPSQPADLISAFGNQATGVASFLVRSTLSFFETLVCIGLWLLLVLFTLFNPEPMVAAYLELVPVRYRPPARRTLIRMMEQMDAWIRGVMLNGLITGVSTGLLLAWVGVQPALVFGVIAFFGEFLPIIGPLIVSVPALFVAASMGFTQFLLALGAILFVQQIETNILIPFVMGKTMNLHPMTIMFFTLAMGTLFGGIGVILVVPAAALVKIVISEFYLEPRGRQNSETNADAKAIVQRRAGIG